MTTTNRTPEDVIWKALRANDVNTADASTSNGTQSLNETVQASLSRRTDLIVRALTEAGFEIVDTLEYNPPKGEDLTEGAGPDETCGCGEPITMYDGEWLHIYNPELRGTDDHDAAP